MPGTEPGLGLVPPALALALPQPLPPPPSHPPTSTRHSRHTAPTAAAAAAAAAPMPRYLVEECGLSLTDRDDFGALPLHFAVLYGHMDTVQWISLNSRHVAARADWAKAFERVRMG